MAKLICKEKRIIAPYYVVYIVYCEHTQIYSSIIKKYFKQNKKYKVTSLEQFTYSNQEFSFNTIFNIEYRNKYGFISAQAGIQYNIEPNEDQNQFVKCDSILINGNNYEIDKITLSDNIVNGTIICASSYQSDCNDYVPKLLTKKTPAYDFERMYFIGQDDTYYESHFDRTEYFYYYVTVKFAQTKSAIKK
jgi:hypothetical protein